jgi:Mn2+/Fe2+ NRAMP family transporter
LYLSWRKSDFARSTLIPWDAVSTADDEGRTITVDTDKDKAKNGPTFDDDREITPEFENEVYSYYGLSRSASTEESGTYEGYYGETATAATTDEDELRVQRTEEELAAGTREREADRILAGLFTPQFAGTDSVLLAAGILGATVMPHVIYLHSALTQRRVVGRNDEERKKIFRFELVDVVIAMAIAGVINASMLIMAAAQFHAEGLTGVGDIDKAFQALGEQVGSTSAILFGVALLASGLSSSSVGTLSGQVVMQGFINRRIPLWLRRLITMTPALVVLGVGLNPSRSLILSQVVLSFGIPFALIPLLIFCRNRNVMGALVNHRITTAIAAVVVTMIVSLNVFLLYQTFIA